MPELPYPLRDSSVAGPVRDFVGYGRHAPNFTWPHGARVALNVALNYEEGSEQSAPLGDDEVEGMVDLPNGMPNGNRDLAVESLYEYGSRAGVWRLARLFDRMALPVTVFASAVALERNREFADWIGERDQDVCAHGWRWEKVWRLDRDAERRRIAVAVESITRTTGRSPDGWYCRYGPSINTRELLVEHGGFRYDADSYADDLPYFTEVRGVRHLVVPYSQLINDGKFVRGTGYASPDDFVRYAISNLDYLIEEGDERPTMMSIGLHPRIAGHPARTAALRTVLEHAAADSRVWVANRAEIADWWLSNYGDHPTQPLGRPESAQGDH